MDNKSNTKVKLNIPHAIVALLITLCMYVILLAVCRITPFGNHTWIVYDMKRQYADFYAYFRSVLSGENNIFYSFSTTLGSGVLGFFTYYLTSPFLFIVALFPASKLPLAISIVIGLKLSLASCTMDMFLQKYCGKSAYLCSVTYGFCGFIIANAMNIMWLDAIIMIPVVMMMTERLLKEGKLVGYIISVAVTIYLNYYVAYMLLIFVLLWFMVRLFAVKEKEPSQAIFRLGMATVAGAAVDAVFLIPAFLELKNNPMEAQELGSGLVVSDLTIRQLISKLFSMSYDSLQIYWGAPMIFCGVAIAILVLLFLLNGRAPWREKVAMLVLLGVFVVSFVYERLNLIWHAGIQITNYPYREAIICVFLLLVCACRGLQELDKGITAGSFVVAGVLAGVIATWVLRHPDVYVSSWKIGLNVALVIATFVLLATWKICQKGIVHLAMAAMIMIMQFADLGLNAAYIYRTESLIEESQASYEEATEAMARAVNQVKELDDGFYRVENWSPRQQNDSMQHAYNGVTHYSMAGLTYARTFLQNLGYNDDEQYADYGHDNTQTADSILGIKYVLTDAAHAGRMHKDYKLVVDGDVQAYENPYALSVATGVYRDMSGESMDPFSLQEDIYSRLAGEMVSIFVPAGVTEWIIPVGRPIEEYIVKAAKSGEMYFYMTDFYDDYNNMEIYVDDEFYSYYGNDSCKMVLNLGYMEEGESIHVRIKADDADDFGNALFVTEDTESLADAYNLVLDRQARIEKISSSHLKLELDSAYTVGDEISGEVGIFTTIPYEKGWKVKVAGAKVAPVEVYDSMMYIPVTEAIQQVELEPGENLEVDIRYVPEGFELGAALSVVTIITMILIASLRKSEADYFAYEDEDDEESNLDGQN